MAYIDIDEYLGEATTKYLVSELESRGYECIKRKLPEEPTDRSEAIPPLFGTTLVEEEALGYVKRILERFGKGDAATMLTGLRQLAEYAP